MVPKYRDMLKLIAIFLCMYFVNSGELLKAKVKDLDSKFELKSSNADPYAKSSTISLSKWQKQIFLVCKVDLKYLNPSQILWERNGKVINQGPPYPLPWSNGSVLMIRPLRIGLTNGRYECVVTKNGVVAKKAVDVNIQQSESSTSVVRIRKDPRRISMKQRTSIDFQCLVEGKAPLNIVWFKNRLPLPKDKRYQISDHDHKDGGVLSNLNVGEVKAGDLGHYQCVVYGNHGQAVSEPAEALKKRRRKRSIVLTSKYDVTSPIKNGLYQQLQCSGGSHLNKDAYPRQIAFDKIRVDCQNSKQDGYHYRIQWVLPDFANYRVTHFQVTIDDEWSNFLCFNVENDTTEFKFTTKNGYIPADEYNFSIVTLPALNGSTSTKPLRACHENSTWEITTTSAPVKETIDHDPRKGNLKIWTYVFSAIGVAALFMIITLCTRLKFRKKRPKTTTTEKNPRPTGTVRVYISHSAQTEPEIERVLELCSKLSNYRNLEIYIDLCNQIHINEVGGLSQWASQKLKDADHIIMIASPKYLQALHDEEDSEELEDVSRKVKFEMNFSRQCLWNGYNTKLVMVMDGVKRDDIPVEFQGIAVVKFPKKYAQLDDNWVTLVGLVFGLNLRQVKPAPAIASV